MRQTTQVNYNSNPIFSNLFSITTIWLCLLSFYLLPGCSSISKTSVEKSYSKIHDHLDIQTLDFPLMLETVHLKSHASYFAPNDQIILKISQTIRDFYFLECGGDSAETYFKLSDSYLGTLRMVDNPHELYMVMLKHQPDGALTSKILFYDQGGHSFVGEAYDFNLHATYEIDHGRIKSTMFKKQFQADTPVMMVSNQERDSNQHYRFTRIFHNGTATAVESLILQVGATRWDTISFDQHWIKE